MARFEKEDPFEGAIREDASGATYFQDRNKRWAYMTSRDGFVLLRALIDAATPLLHSCMRRMSEYGEIGELRSEGAQIYAQKPNLGQRGVTWSQENYAHLGLQCEYLRLKSIQRFTETWVALERAWNAGLFSKIVAQTAGAAKGSVPFRVASLGGGPGV